MGKKDQETEIWNYVHSWNYRLGESWSGYLQRRAITTDLNEAKRESARAMIGAISGQTGAILLGMESSARIVLAGIESSAKTASERILIGMDSFAQTVSERMDKNHNELSEHIGQGFGMLEEHLGAITGEISNLNATLECSFGNVLASLNGMGDSLEALIEIAKTPTQTAAYEHFEIARDAFRQGLDWECLEAVNKALVGDRRSSGYKLEWRFHRLAGVVLLGYAGCDPSIVDLQEAERAFLIAAKYARADEPKEAALSMLQAGLSAYVQRNLRDALAYTEEAVALDPRMGEAQFQAAKFLMGDKRPEEALRRLRQAVDISPDYVIKASADSDFKPFEKNLNNFLSALLVEKRSALVALARPALKEAENWAETVCEMVICKAIIERWYGLLKGDGGLLDLLKYERKIGQDQQEVKDIFFRGVARIEQEKKDRERAERERQEKAEKERIRQKEKSEKERWTQEVETKRAHQEWQEKVVREQRDRNEAEENNRQIRQRKIERLIVSLVLLAVAGYILYAILSSWGIVGLVVIIILLLCLSGI